ncbi:MAG: phenylacetate--CoA ligase family protein [Pseudomonadota bacterium]
MTDHFDALETRSPDEREASVMECLRAQLTMGRETTPALAEALDGVDPAGITDRAALARLPILRKASLVERQRKAPPFGGLAARPAHEFDHLFQSPGPIYEPGMTSVPDWWRFARALHAAGIRSSDRVHNAFAYHLTPAGTMLESGARALGCAVIPGGVGNTEAQVTAAADCGATAYIGTPDFLKVMLEKAAEIGRDLSAITRAWVSGGALFPSLREGYREAGIQCLQGYATADLGSIAYETTAMEGLIVDEGVIVEILRPGTGDPVPEGEVGEVAVTLLNADYPLLRFCTGDLSAILPGTSPCGRTNMRIRGWMGRADQTAKVKGMFVRPEQVAAIVARHDAVTKARLTVSREAEQDAMILTVETAEADPALADAVAGTLRDVLKLRGHVETAAPGSLPNDGKVIDDTRDYG